MEMSADKVRSILKIAQEAISLETPVGDDGDSSFGDFIEDKGAESPANATAFSVFQERLDEVLGSLTEREEKVLAAALRPRRRLPRTLEEVGSVFNVTRERVRQIEAKALRKMRHPTRARELKAFVDWSLSANFKITHPGHWIANGFEPVRNTTPFPRAETPARRDS
jgi:RNA polymerase primary sigma factor